MAWAAQLGRSVTAVAALSASGALGAALEGQERTPRPPELPRATVETRFAPSQGRTRDVPRGGDLQAALDAARPGDVIRLAPGSTFSGNFVLPAKTGDAYVVIRTNLPDDNLPSQGTRVTPHDATPWAKIVTPNDLPALRTASGAHHYRLMALEVTALPSARATYSLVAVHADATRSARDVPHHIILDRVFVHGRAEQQLRRCVLLDGAFSAVIDSHVADCHARGFDSQAILGFDGPGPVKIENNYLEGAGEIVMFGGADPSIEGSVPSDITIHRNHFTRPLAWKDRWTIKNLLELKNARRVSIEGNVFENHWPGAQNGFAIVFKSTNQDGGCTWCTTSDVTFRYNWLRNVSGGFAIAAAESPPVVTARRFAIAHNVLERVNVPPFDGSGRLLMVLKDVADVTFEHNTMLAADATASVVVFGELPQVPGFVFRNNLFNRGEYGVMGSDRGEGKNALDFYLTEDYVFRGNVIVGAPGRIYPPGNHFPATAHEAGLRDIGAGDYRLRADSPYRGRATDGTDPGADIDRVRRAIAGVREGRPAPPSP